MKREELKNDVKIVGELVNKEVRRNNEGKADETISLELTVRVSEVEEHVVSFFAYKYGMTDVGNNKKERKINKDKISKLFTGYETVVREFKAISDENGDGTGEKVDIKGSLSKNMYVGKDEQMKEIMKIKGTFCSRVTDMTKYTPCAVWSAHMHITKIDDEAKDVTGEYTKVMGMVVDYVEDEMEFRIYHEKVRKGFGKVYEQGESALFKGNIVNRPDEAVVEVEDDEDSWGVDMDVEADTSTIRRRYLEILKGDPKAMDTDDEDHPLNEEKIKEYKKNITKRKADIVSKHEKKQKSSVQIPKVDPNAGTSVADDDDIPF